MFITSFNPTDIGSSPTPSADNTNPYGLNLYIGLGLSMASSVFIG